MSLDTFRARFELRSEQIDGEAWDFVESDGPGEALVMLPGALGTCEIFYKQFEAFAEDHRLIAVSYPGLQDGARVAEGLAEFLRRRSLASCSLLGSSLGGYWLQVFAARFPQAVEALILANTFIDGGPVQANPLFDRRQLLRERPEETRQRWGAFLAGLPEGELKTVLNDLARRQTAENLRGRLLAVVTGPPAPVLPPARISVVQCDDDATLSGDIALAMRERFAAAAIHRLPTGGHYPHVVNPADFNGVVAQALGVGFKAR